MLRGCWRGFSAVIPSEVFEALDAVFTILSRVLEVRFIGVVVSCPREISTIISLVVLPVEIFHIC